MITSSTLQNDNIQAFKNDKIYTMKNDNILYTRNDNIQAFKKDKIYTMKNDPVHPVHSKIITSRPLQMTLRT